MPPTQKRQSQTESSVLPPRKRAKLSGSRLERKRELDREAQRSIRKKTKNYIAHLENLVQSLQAANQDNDRVKELVTQINEDREEIDQLREALEGIGKIVSAVLQPRPRRQVADASHDASSSSAQNPMSVDLSKDEDSESESPESVNSPAQPSPLKTIPVPSFTTPRTLRTDGQYINSSADHITPSVQNLDTLSYATVVPPPIPETVIEPVILSETHQDVAMAEARFDNGLLASTMSNNWSRQQLWRRCSDALNLAIELGRQQPQTPGIYFEDICIRAILHGWHSVALLYQLDAGWRWLRLIDQVLFPNSGIPERMVVIRLMRSKYESQVQSDANPILPLPWYLETRPAQNYVKHKALDEHWAWPGLREHFFFNPGKYVSNVFMELFRQGFRFLWPAGPEETYIQDLSTGMFSFAPAFLDKQDDLRCLTQSPDFFEKFPELRRDIASYPESPLACRPFLNSLNEWSSVAGEGDGHEIPQQQVSRIQGNPLLGGFVDAMQPVLGTISEVDWPGTNTF